MIRAVLDTNVIVSSFLNTEGVPGELRGELGRAKFSLCMSRPILEEVRDFLSRARILRAVKTPREVIRDFLADLPKDSLFVHELPRAGQLFPADPDDDMILATALATNADYIVTGDKPLLDLKEFRGIPIVTPRVFLEILKRTGDE
ncbi:putative toxin-antitoxin system toxin component, PIN family [Candidatus Sumerlaeota bacterium]|nr:putative toxin-antitoxin system toxin component, PIN family [Candidatus Sumerlaeota bacterium]